MAILADLSLRLRANAAELSEGLNKAKQSLGTFKDQTKKLTSDISKGIEDSLSKLTFGMSDVAKSVLTASRTAITGLKGIQKAFISTGIGAVVIGITIAVTGLITAFKRNQEVADRFKIVMAGLKGVLDVIIGVLVDVGKWLTKAFSDPRQAIKDIVSFIKDRVVTSFQGLVQIFISGWKAISDGAMGVGNAILGIFNKDKRAKAKEFFTSMTDEFKKMSEGVLMVFTGSTFDDWNNAAEKVVGTVQNATDLERQRQALRDQQISDLDEISRREIEIAKIKNEAEQLVGDSEEEKLKRQELFKKALQEQVKVGELKVGIAQREYDLVVATNRQRSDTSEGARQQELEARLKVRAAEKEALEKQEEYLRENATLSKEIGKIQAETTADAEAQAEAVELTLDQKRALAEEEYRLKTTYDGQREALKNLYDTGVIGLTEYQDKLKAVDEAFAVEGTQAFIAQENEKKEAAISARVDAINEILRYEQLSIDEQKALYEELYNLQEIGEKELAALKAELDEEERQRRMQNINDQVNMGIQALTALSDFNEAAMNNELKMAGDNEAKKEQIRKKYAKREKALMIAEAIANTALAVINALQTKPFIPAGLAAAALATGLGAAQIAKIQSVPLAKGGIAYGETLATVGEYPGARSNPEVIAPLKDLKNILGNMGGFGIGEVKFVIEQDKLVGILSNYNNKNIYF